MRAITFILRLVVDHPGAVRGQLSDPVAAWQVSFADLDELARLLMAHAAAGRGGTGAEEAAPAAPRTER